jgi:hypothetical protein
MRPLKPCLDCGRLQQLGSRCRTCTQRRDAERNSSRPQYQGEWRHVRARVIQLWIDQHGLICPGWGRAPHPAADLTGDHNDDGTIGVLCRSCNGRKGATHPVFGRSRADF